MEEQSVHSETGLLSLGREGGGGENTGSAGPWAGQAPRSGSRRQ